MTGTSVLLDPVTTMLIGYGRVSTAAQNPAHQVDALTRAGVAERDIHLDTASGAKASRPKLDLVLQFLREGDTLVITRLDRLSHSALHLVTLGAQLRERGVGLKVTDRASTPPRWRAAPRSACSPSWPSYSAS
jgi:DNA invertase Pin-like site-specific DNA recombinase